MQQSLLPLRPVYQYSAQRLSSTPFAYMVMKENMPLSERDTQANEAPAFKKTKTNDKFLVKKLSEHAFAPKRGSSGAAGYDLAR